MRKDYKVTPRDRSELKSVADKLRAIVPDRERSSFNIAEFVRTLAQKELLRTGKLLIQFFTALDRAAPAYVTYNPTTLHVDFGTWQDADAGEPSARFIIAHELGHIVLHDSYAQPFSGVKQKWIQFDEESAEWQANIFAEYFLISEWEIENSKSVFELAMVCSVDRSVACRRLRTQYKSCGYSCPTCGAHSILQIGISQWCFECGWAISV